MAVGAIFLGSLGTANRLAQSRTARSCHLRLLRGVLRRPELSVVGVGVLSEFTGTFPAVLTLAILLEVRRLEGETAANHPAV